MDRADIRNFCVIAHIDHGKSTLSDRLLELTGAVDPRKMAAQFLDSMDLEREKGITIKARAVQMRPQVDGRTYELNLIDTPGHVDFSYEVSRSLAAAEGALLVVDAAEGIQAQTLANVYLAMEQDLTLIPVINKIDLPVARPQEVAQELMEIVGFAEEELLYVSAKTGEGVAQLLQAIIERIPAPAGEESAPARALIFDSVYDPYKGVLAYVRVMDGAFRAPTALRLVAARRRFEPLECGVFAPDLTPQETLSAGEVGYIATGLKETPDVRVGDTISAWAPPLVEPLAGYQEPKAMVFAGLFPTEASDFPLLTDALQKLHLNDAALQFAPETSTALGFGYRMGFLGLLHMEIVQERLEREYGLTLIFTAPSVEYEVETTDGVVQRVDNPADWPDTVRIAEAREPWVAD